MKVTFWGVRGSIPAPISSLEIKHKVAEVLKQAIKEKITSENQVEEFVDSFPYYLTGTAGGNTSCVEIATPHNLIVFDAGSGIRQLGNKLMAGDFGKGEGTVNIFISHTHWDHIMGFPFFIPAYIKGNSVNIYGCHPELRSRFKNQHNPQHFPVHLESMSANIDFNEMKPDQTILLGDCNVISTSINHPGGSFAYRVEHNGKKIVYATDSEYKDLSESGLEKYLKFYHGCDVLIFDAMYTLADALEKEDWGHSSSLIGAEIAMAANIKKLILFHHEPNHNDSELQGILERTSKFIQKNADHECEVILAYEGLELNI